MSTVNTEGKLDWYLGIELSLRSLGAYLQLGLSLGAVQLRHACVPYHLAVYKAACLWRRSVTHSPEDGVLYLGGNEEDEGAAAAVNGKNGVNSHHNNNKTLHSSAAPAHQTIVTRPVSSQVSGPVDPHAFLAELLAKFDALAAITHGEAADVKLLTRMTQQDLLVREHRADQKAAGVDGHASTHASEESVVFRLSETDASYTSVRSAGHPVAITYRDFVLLTTLVSEALAWDLLWIHEALDRQAKATARASGIDAPAPWSSSAHRIEADCIAVMLPNSVEYNALWMAAARSGPLHTFLDVLYRNSNHIIGSGDRGGTYRPCRTALINTNLASNAMLYHAIACSGSVVVLLDAMFVPLLFCDSEAADGMDDHDGAETNSAMEEKKKAKSSGARLKLHVPPHVKRIYLWRCATSTGELLHKGMTSEMEALLKDFNAAAYGDSADLTGLLPTPPLDLYDSVKEFYKRAQVTPSFTVQEVRHTYLISSPKARVLVQRILTRPPPGWRSLLALSQHNTTATTTAAAVSPVVHPCKRQATVPQATVADSARGRAQLEHYKAKMAAILSVLLRRFHHTQPVLFIYTSGTTGLPKAARFSHLRFFATGFLSRVLYYRDRIAETVVEQLDEVDYVAEHPYAVQRQALASREGGASDLAAAAASDGDRCPPIPQVFGVKLLDTTRRRRTTVEATLVIVCNVVLWWVRYLASLCGLEYVVSTAAERCWYTPAQLAAVEEERRLVTIYNCLPMYHTVGSVFCLGHLLHALEEQQYAWAQVRRCSSTRTHLAATVPTVRMVLRTKFSASQFCRDLQRYHVTVVQYIGEVLRYAVLYERSHAPATIATTTTVEAEKAAGASSTAVLPPAVAEAVALAAASRTTWRVPYAFGNGLRQDIWLECMKRLNIAHPVEFYSSTEGNIFLLNLFGIPGVVGHIPRFPWPIAWLSMQYFPLFPFRVLKFDEEAQQVYRDPKTGYCAHCPVNEVGEVVGEVIEGFDLFALRRFDGYHKAAANVPTAMTAASMAGGSPAASPPPTADAEEDAVARQSKVLRHVLWPYTTDCYFLSGDLIRMDRYGLCSFVDRVGDTFRWKGENVSTLEVSNAVNSIHTTRVGVQEAVVYGVQVPGREGRAGMAMLSLQPSHVRADYPGKGDVASGEALQPSSHAVSLAEERRFMQEDLYGFLTGKVARSGDGKASQATLPAYAIPLFVRMQDPLPAEDGEGESTNEEEESDSTAALTATSASSNKHAETSPLITKGATDDATQTTTFKYKRGVLIKQGYAFEGSSTTAADIPAEAWGTATAMQTSSGVSIDDESTPYTRLYVLVTNPVTFKMLALPSVCDGATTGVETTLKAGYVPLTAASIKVLGENMDKCGW